MAVFLQIGHGDLIAKSAVAVEYANCTSAEALNPHQRVFWYDTEQYDS